MLNRIDAHDVGTQHLIESQNPAGLVHPCKALGGFATDSRPVFGENRSKTAQVYHHPSRLKED